MKRDYLKGLGLAEDAINGIMAENGKDIESAKGDLENVKQQLAAKDTELEGYKSQIAKRDADIDTLKATVKDGNAFKAQLDELKAKYDQDTADFKAQLAAQQTAFERDRAMEKFFSGVEFSSGLAKDAAIAQFKAKKFTLDNGTFIGATEWINELRTSMPDAFKAKEEPKPETPKAPQFSKPMNGGTPDNANPFSFSFNSVR